MQLDLPLTQHDMSGRGGEDAVDMLLAQSAARSGGAGGLDNDGRLVRLRVLRAVGKRLPSFVVEPGARGSSPLDASMRRSSLPPPPSSSGYLVKLWTRSIGISSTAQRY